MVWTGEEMSQPPGVQGAERMEGGRAQPGQERERIGELRWDAGSGMREGFPDRTEDLL